MSYADDYEEESWLNPGIEHAIDEEYANFTGTGLRPTKKENTVTVDIEVAKARLKDAEAATRRARSAEEMRRVEVAELERKARKLVDEPGWQYLTVQVQFDPKGTVYRYLFLRVGGVYYSSGDLGKGSLQVTWNQLVDWLHGVHWHGKLYRLEPVGNNEYLEV